MATEEAQNMSSGGLVDATSFLGSKDPVDSDSSSALALQHFFTLSVAAGISNLGVLLEILHVANYDASKASRIVELIKGSPPTEPAIIATSPGQMNNGDGSKSSTGQGSCVQAQDCAVQAFGDGLVASAAAASPYSAAVVSCAPGSAGVGVGTSSGTTTSTAVPFSAVTSLPQNSIINMDFSPPGCVKASTSPNDSAGTSGGSTSKAGSQSMATNPAVVSNQTANGLGGVKSQAVPPRQEQQTLPLLQNKRTVPAKPLATSSSMAGKTKPTPMKVASSPQVSGSHDNRQPQSQAEVSSGGKATETPNVTAPVIDEMDPLKLTKLQEIIDILKG